MTTPTPTDAADPDPHPHLHALAGAVLTTLPDPRAVAMLAEYATALRHPRAAVLSTVAALIRPRRDRGPGSALYQSSSFAQHGHTRTLAKLRNLPDADQQSILLAYSLNVFDPEHATIPERIRPAWLTLALLGPSKATDAAVRRIAPIYWQQNMTRADHGWQSYLLGLRYLADPKRVGHPDSAVDAIESAAAFINPPPATWARREARRELRRVVAALERGRGRGVPVVPTPHFSVEQSIAVNDALMT